MVGQELYTNLQIADNSSTAKFIISCFQSVLLQERVGDKDIMSSWVCVKSLLSSAKVTEMHVGILPFIPKPVTEYSTFYTSMLNFVKIVKQFDQDAVLIFCDKGVFRILIDIYLQRKDEFQILIQMRGGFHETKCIKHCIDKYLE